MNLPHLSTTKYSRLRSKHIAMRRRSQLRQGMEMEGKEGGRLRDERSERSERSGEDDGDSGGNEGDLIKCERELSLIHI